MKVIEAYAKITFANGRQVGQMIAAAANNVHEALNFAIGDFATNEALKLTKQGKDSRIKLIEVEFNL